MSLWRNRLARSAVNRKVGGSNPPRDEIFFYSNRNEPYVSSYFQVFNFQEKCYLFEFFKNRINCDAKKAS
jgi:hypothetical protein